MNYVELDSVSKTISKVQVLRSVNLSIPEGQVVALWGRNASGKTMLLRAMSGLILPTTGTVTIDGKQLTPYKPHPNSLGIIIETIKFWPLYTGFDCLKILASIRNAISDDDIRATMIRVGLDPCDRRTLRKYSMGMRQRLAIAQAIMERPKLLLLDEPTNSLDQEGRELFHQIINDEKSRGATIIIATHIIEDINSLCDLFYEVDNGSVRPLLRHK